MQGIYLAGQRPVSKVAIKRAVAAGDVDQVSIEATSMMGNEYDGPLDEAPVGRINFVGPDPYTKRNFYGTINVAADGSIKVT